MNYIFVLLLFFRSLCSLVCKFNYMGHSSQQINGKNCIFLYKITFNSYKHPFIHLNDLLGNSGWIPSFWSSIGLSEFVEDNFKKLGKSLLNNVTKK